MPDLNATVEYKGVSLTQRELDNLLSGMKNPTVRRLSPGTKLFRVADASRAQDSVFQVDGEAGGWWTGQKAFNKMMQYCVQQDKADRGLGYAAREACAVLFGWSSCDLLVEAYVKTNVNIFFGKGNPQSEGGVTFKGWDDIEQWFIPGIAERGDRAGGGQHVRLSSKGKSAIEVYRTCSLRSVLGNAQPANRA